MALINIFINNIIVQFQKISILPSQEGLELPGGGGFCSAKKFKEMYEANNWNFQRSGGGGSLRQNPFYGGGMDIFWNYTIPVDTWKTLD